jgi:hypothetical protein
MDPAAGSFNGICVECESDCDCDVNQYCGIDKISVSVSPPLFYYEVKNGPELPGFCYSLFSCGKELDASHNRVRLLKPTCKSFGCQHFSSIVVVRKK